MHRLVGEQQVLSLTCTGETVKSFGWSSGAFFLKLIKKKALSVSRGGRVGVFTDFL